jgi:hypothetical protein
MLTSSKSETIILLKTQQRYDNNGFTNSSTGFACVRSYQEQVSATNGSNGHTAIW